MAGRNYLLRISVVYNPCYILIVGFSILLRVHSQSQTKPPYATYLMMAAMRGQNMLWTQCNKEWTQIRCVRWFCLTLSLLYVIKNVVPRSMQWEGRVARKGGRVTNTRGHPKFHADGWTCWFDVLSFGVVYLDWCDVSMGQIASEHQIVCKYREKKCEGDESWIDGHDPETNQ
jgi:hypothetical protein